MAAVLPSTTREILLADTPGGLPGPERFTVAQKPVPVPGPGQVVVRNRYFLVFPGLRTLIGGQVDGVPLPRIHAGDALFGPAVGEVVAAASGGPLRPGDTVTHLLGWREHALVAAADCTPLGDVLPDPVAHLSSGSAAYGALTRHAQVRPGDTVFVTGAAGAVGTLAGPVVRLLGATRVIGSTRSPDKAERLQAELGYDAVVAPGPRPMDKQMAAAAPGGIDVLLDTVGGEQLTPDRPAGRESTTAMRAPPLRRPRLRRGRPQTRGPRRRDRPSDPSAHPPGTTHIRTRAVTTRLRQQDRPRPERPGTTRRPSPSPRPPRCAPLCGATRASQRRASPAATTSWGTSTWRTSPGPLGRAAPAQAHQELQDSDVARVRDDHPAAAQRERAARERRERESG